MFSRERYVPQNQDEQRGGRNAFIVVREIATFAPAAQSIFFSIEAAANRDPASLFAAALAFGGTPLIKWVADKLEERYERQREEQIRNLPEPEPTLSELVSRT